MNYPKSIVVGGQTIQVETTDTPLLKVYTCPDCGPGFRFFLPFKEGGVCPACGRKNPQPIDNTYALGQFDILKNTITTWKCTDKKVREQCETSFVHEVIEAINSIHGLELEHPKITTLGTALYQAFTSGGVDFSYASAA